ncbi:MAG: hypothetical protein H0V17_27140 [Deltaproteobacteria bacterium]|nr:hypothetical protein [Deltaproteobacteria bacterium]
MPDDERTRRRLGDATKSRIADLASGWSVGDEPEPTSSKPEPTPIPELTPDPEPEPPPRARRKTQPPPPPGSAERKKLEDAILDSVPTLTPVPDSIVVKPPSKVTPPKGNAPFGAKSGPTETGTVALTGAIGKTPPPLVSSTKPARDDETDVTGPPPSVPPPPPKARIDKPLHQDRELADLFGREPPKEVTPKPVPRGEFEAGGLGTEVEQDKRRIAYEQSTLKRDAASALLQIPEQPQTTVRPQPVEVLLNETAQTLLRGDPTALDSQTSKFERGDPTNIGSDPTVAQTNLAAVNAGTLRAQAALRRKRGLGGDMRYVLTVLFGVRKARTELVALEARQELRQQSRRRHLVTLGRSAATLDGFDHPALGPARELLSQVEDERSRHAGSVAEADSELMRVRRDREAKAKELVEAAAAIEKELVEVDKKIEPLQKEVVGVARRAEELKESLRKLDIKIANTEMSQHSVAGQRERAAIQAELATLKADRVAVKRDEPKLAGELDVLNPRIAALEARRAEARKRKTELDKAEIQDQRRAEELLAAIGAKRKVVDRASNDAETMRDKVLFELGERLYHDRPLDLGPQLAPIDVIDVELGTGDRRMMELKEILSSVDKAKLARGVAMFVIVLAAITIVTLLVLGML